MRSISAAMALYALCLSALIVPESAAQKIRPEARSPKTEAKPKADIQGETESPSAVQSPSSSQIDIVGPAGSGQFGQQVYILPNGNIVVTDPLYDITTPSTIADVGAVYLYDGETLALISQLTGSTASDQVGNGGITILSNGNYVIKSSFWRNGTAMFAGAATWASATDGVSGTVSSANSLVGTRSGDSISTVTALTNGNYIVHSINWDNGPTAENAGSATFCNGATGTSGAVTATNSLVGTTPFANVGGQIIPLPSGNYLVYNNVWPTNNVERYGAVTWGSGTTGVSGPVSSANSLVGSTTNDSVGSDGITILPNGNYVVRSSNWDNGAAVNAGAVTWGSGTAGVTGVVSAANSLVSSSANERLGLYLLVLANGNYVVSNPIWDNGAVANVGAVTWGSGTTGVAGVISASNSLVGSSASDVIGSTGITALNNGNYVVRSPHWDNGAIQNVGAITWGNGSIGTIGPVSVSNSFIGSSTDDGLGNLNSKIAELTNGNFVVSSNQWNQFRGAVTWFNGSVPTSGVASSGNSLVGVAVGDYDSATNITALANGNYVVNSPNWDNGATVNVGAVTWGNGTTGISGVASASNSLIGSTADDQVGSFLGVVGLTNGNYVVTSPNWDNGAVVNAGAATFASGTSGLSGVVSPSNSLVGTSANDRVGEGAVALSNGNYVVRCINWDNGASTNAGAVTWGNGTTGTSGIVSPSNSLVGTTTNDQIGGQGISPLDNGHYLVLSGGWSNGAATYAGAVTWGDGAAGVSGPVSAANSLVGSQPSDYVGNGGVVALANANYVVLSPLWRNGAIVSAGAVTYGAGNGGTVGTIDSSNSVLGTVASGVIASAQPTSNPISNERLVVARPSSNTVSVFNPTYTAVASGNWSDGATWNYGAFEKPHDVVIPSGRTVTLDADVPGPGGSVTVESGGQLVVDGERASESPITNAGVVDMSMGKLNMGANMFSSVCGAIENGAGADNYIVGAANKEFCTPGSYTFPIGTTNGYAPVNVNITSLNANPSSLTISSTASVHPNLYAPNSLGRFWSITESGDLTADFVFNYLDADVNGVESSYKLYRVAGGDPQLQTATLNAAANTMSITGVSQFSEWAIGNLAPTAASVSVSGRVTANGRPVSGVTVLFQGVDGAVRSAVTNTFGHYRVDGLAAGFGYVASVVSRRYSFESQYVELTDNLTGLDFNGR
jgi:hypothetical protein